MADSKQGSAALNVASCFKCPDEGADNVSPPQGSSTASSNQGKEDSLYDNNVCPFINDVLEKLTLGQKIQLLIGSFTLAPIRLIFVVISLAFLWPIGSLLNIGLDSKFRHPIGKFRKSLFFLAKFFGRALFFFGGFQHITVYGTPDPKVRIYAAAPHTGFYDALLTVYLNFCSVVGRAGSEKVLVFGNLTKLCQPIIVDRENRESRSDSVKQLVDRVNSKEDWPPILIFCEGTCGNRKGLVKFKPGAFIPGVPVQPLGIKLPTGSMDTMSWTWESPHPYTLAWLTLCRIHVPIEFHFLPVYYPSEEEKVNAELYSENVRKVIAKAIGAKLTDYSFEDGYIMAKATEYNLPWRAGLVKVQDLRKRFNIKINEIYTLVPVFANIADHNKGVCFEDTFARNLGVFENESTRRLYKLFDNKNQGSFTLERFIESYYENVFPAFKDDGKSKCINQVIETLGLSENNQDLTIDQLKSEINAKYSLRFVTFDRFNLKENETTIGRERFVELMEKYPLHLFLFMLASMEKLPTNGYVA